MALNNFYFINILIGHVEISRNWQEEDTIMRPSFIELYEISWFKASLLISIHLSKNHINNIIFIIIGGDPTGTGRGGM